MDSINKFIDDVSQKFTQASNYLQALMSTLSGESTSLQKSEFKESSKLVQGALELGQKHLSNVTGSRHASPVASTLAQGLSSSGAATSTPQELKHTNALGDRKSEAIRLIMGDAQPTDDLSGIEEIMSSTSGLLKDRIEMREEAKQKLTEAETELKAMQDKLPTLNTPEEKDVLSKFIKVKGHEVEKLELQYKQLSANVRQNMAANLAYESKEPVKSELNAKRSEICEEFRGFREQVQEKDKQELDHAVTLTKTYSTDQLPVDKTFQSRVQARDESKHALTTSKNELETMRGRLSELNKSIHSETDPQRKNDLTSKRDVMTTFFEVKKEYVSKLELIHKKEEVNVAQHKLAHLASNETDSDEKKLLNNSRNELWSNKNDLEYGIKRNDYKFIDQSLRLTSTYYPGKSAAEIEADMAAQSPTLRVQIEKREEAKRALENAKNRLDPIRERLNDLREKISNAPTEVDAANLEKECASVLESFKEQYGEVKELESDYNRDVANVEQIKLTDLANRETDAEKEKILRSKAEEIRLSR